MGRACRLLTTDGKGALVKRERWLRKRIWSVVRVTVTEQAKTRSERGCARSFETRYGQSGPHSSAPSARAASQHAMRVARKPLDVNSFDIGANPIER